MTVQFNHIFAGFWALVAILAAIPQDVATVFPPTSKPWIIGAVVAAMWIKAHRNLFVNPDGSNAKTAWDGQQ